MRLLVIEDEKRLARNLAELLRRQGYTVDISSDGVSGYDNASTDLYDLILLDAMLPGMDGFSLLRKLRAGGHAVPVLMLTARSDLSDRVQGLDCGADYYLTKPFEPKELLACIRALTRRQPELRQTDAAGRRRRPDRRRHHLRGSAAGAGDLSAVLRGAVPAAEPPGIRHAGAAAAQPGPGGAQGAAAAEGVGL